MLDGLLFGFIDNGVLAICALLGIDLDKKFAGKGTMGPCTVHYLEMLCQTE